MELQKAQELLQQEEDKKQQEFNNKVEKIVKQLTDIIDNGNVVITYEIEQGDLVITIKNKHYKGLSFFQPKVVVTVVYDCIVDEYRSCYKYVNFFTEVFSSRYELSVAKFIVYLYDKLKLNYETTI